MSPQSPLASFRPNILVVDDNPTNLQLLVRMLKDQGYKARPALNGKLALRAAAREVPDLILLDVNMPEMNGYEVCERLKKDERLAGVPVIFVSALNETVDKVKAFAAGGVDYVTKPFQFREIEARVAVHIELCRRKRELEESYERLRKLEELRDALVHMVVHDMRTPLTAILGYMQLLEIKESENLSENGRNRIRQVMELVDNLMEMMNSLLDVSRMESGNMRLNLSGCELVGTVRTVLQGLESLAREHQVEVNAPDDPVTVVADQELIERVIGNLLANALKYTPVCGSVKVTVRSDPDSAFVSVTDDGCGIPEEYHERIFEKFGQVEANRDRRKHSTGLGLTFCKLVVEAHGGKIGVHSKAERGSTFWFELPRRPQCVHDASVIR
ncbi:MAG: ATP-binding protein [Syntrophobacteraceae bacterium]